MVSKMKRKQQQTGQAGEWPVKVMNTVTETFLRSDAYHPILNYTAATSQFSLSLDTVY